MTDQESKNGGKPTRASTPASKKRSKKKSGRSASKSEPVPSAQSSSATGAESPSLSPSSASSPDKQPGPVQERVAEAGGSASGSNPLSVFAIVLSVLALAGAGYAWYQTAVNARLSGGEQTQRISSMEQRFADISSDQSGVAAQIDQIKSRVASAENGVADQVSLLRQQVSGSETAAAEQISQVKQLVSKTESALSGQISEIRASVNDQQKQVADSVARAEREVASQTEQFRNEFGELSSSIDKVNNELGSSVDSWREREVEHLLVIANQRLQLGNDPASARQALQLAEDQLREMARPSMLKVRQQISADLAALYEVESPDLASVTGTLSLLSQTLGNLPVKGETNVPAAADNTEVPDSPEEGDESGGTGERMARLGKTFLTDLGGLIQVEKGGEPVAPSITPEVSRMIVARGRLMLEGAQVALLRSQPEIYVNRLDAAGTWVSENFESDAGSTRNWLSQLEDVKKIAPVAEYPDISGSLQMLREAMSAAANGGQAQ